MLDEKAGDCSRHNLPKPWLSFRAPCMPFTPFGVEASLPLAGSLLRSAVNGLPSVVARPQSIAVALRKPPMNKDGCKTNVACSSSLRCHWISGFPARPRMTAKTPYQGAGAGSCPHPLRHQDTEQYPSPLSSLQCARHHPLARKRFSDCPARRSPRPAVAPAAVGSAPTCGTLPDFGV